jgi:tetratricopeptide (TPR) repeat protein
LTFLIALALLQSAPATSELPATDPVPLPGPRTLGILDADRFDRCHDAATDDAVTGMAEAQAWLVAGGGFVARQCLGFAQAKGGLYDAAAISFATAAQEAEVARDWRVGNLWAQAGNAALAAGDPSAARGYLDAALAQGRLTGLALGEAHLDRARAALALEDWPAARTDLEQAAQHAAQDPLVWLLSATLARRQGDMVRAQADIAVAARLGPRDPAIALEAGNIAATVDDRDVAERHWLTAVQLGPATPQADAARARLDELRHIRESELMHIGRHIPSSINDGTPISPNDLQPRDATSESDPEAEAGSSPGPRLP